MTQNDLSSPQNLMHLEVVIYKKRTVTVSFHKLIFLRENLLLKVEVFPE